MYKVNAAVQDRDRGIGKVFTAASMPHTYNIGFEITTAVQSSECIHARIGVETRSGPTWHTVQYRTETCNCSSRRT